jgi:hypothetical protein
MNGIRFLAEQETFLSPQLSDLLWGPLSLLSNGHHTLSPVVNPPERDVDHSSSFNAEVMHAWSNTYKCHCYLYPIPSIGLTSEYILNI